MQKELCPVNKWENNRDQYRYQGLTDLTGVPVYLFDTTSSTNDVAKQLLSQGQRGPLLVLADSQTAGRGRLGRQFASPSGTGIYMSILLTDQRILQHASQITAAVSVLVVEAIRQVTGVQTQIKWINDIYLEGKKLCGILTEAVAGQSGVHGVVIGIGINFRTQLALLPPDVASTAATLADYLPDGVMRSDLVGCITRKITEELADRLEQRTFLPDYRRWSCVLGRQVMVHPAGGEAFPALAEEIDDEAALIVRTAAGRQRLSTGEISIRFVED